MKIEIDYWGGCDMLEKLLKDWKGEITVDGKIIESCNFDFKTLLADSHIVLQSTHKNVSKTKATIIESDSVQYRITVKRYMTEKSSPSFDFMAKWNNDNPMPLRTMLGEKVKETRGMVYMKLHGDIYAEKICTCMKCGRALTNPVSQYFGIGPECGGHNYVNPFNSQDELKEAVSAYRKQLQNITWEGWIIKSAITEQEEI